MYNKTIYIDIIIYNTEITYNDRNFLFHSLFIDSLYPSNIQDCVDITI